MVKFNKYAVVNTESGVKARVSYSRFALTDGTDGVTIYAKDYGHKLAEVLGSDLYQNDTDSQTDYFETGRVRIPAGHPMFEAACARAEAS